MVAALHFVLDHNFPTLPEVRWPPSIAISRLKDVDHRLIEGFEDWHVLLALHQRGGVDAFVTQDAGMLSLPTELVVLSLTRLCLVVTSDSGQSPTRASGLLLAGLEVIANRIRNEGPRIFVLAMRLIAKDVHAEINRVAQHQRGTPPELIAREMGKVGDLEQPVLPL